MKIFVTKLYEVSCECGFHDTSHWRATAVQSAKQHRRLEHDGDQVEIVSGSRKTSVKADD